MEKETWEGEALLNASLASSTNGEAFHLRILAWVHLPNNVISIGDTSPNSAKTVGPVDSVDEFAAVYSSFPRSALLNDLRLISTSVATSHSALSEP